MSKKTRNLKRKKKSNPISLFISIFIKAILILFVIILTIFLVKNFERIKNGEMTIEEAFTEFIQISKDIDIVKGLKNLKKDQHHKYLDKITPGDKDINTLASKLVYKCSNNNKVCETSKLLSYVSNKIKYRSDQMWIMTI